MPNSVPDVATRPTAAGGTRWGKRARRDVRHAAALANELNMHSFRIHGDGSITWILWHDKVPGKAKHNCDSAFKGRKITCMKKGMQERMLV